MLDNRTLQAQISLLHVKIEQTRAAHHLTEGALKHHDEGIDKWFEEQLEKLESTDPDDEEYLEFLVSEQKAEAADAYPQLLRSAIFLASYAVLEFFLTSLCKVLEQTLTGPRLSDLKGDGITRAKVYLERVASVPMPESSEWNDLLAYGHLRNALVHSLGDVSTNPRRQAIEQLQKRAGTFSIATNGESVTLAKEFHPRFAITVDRFAEQVDEALGKAGL